MKILTDIWYSRRQRVHQLIGDNQEVLFTSHKVTDCIEHAITLGIDSIILAPDDTDKKNIHIKIIRPPSAQRK